MAIKLTKAQEKDFTDFRLDTHIASVELSKAVDAFNEATHSAFEALQSAVEKFNEAQTDFRGFVEELVSTWQGESDEKSDAWRDGARGQAAAQFIEAWETYGSSLEDVEIEEPATIEVEAFDFEEDELPRKPEQEG